LAVLLRGQGARFWLAAAAAGLLATTLVVFFLWTYPANQATENWTLVPENWRGLRSQWEYSHATNAVLVFVAYCCVAFAALLEPD
jgi:hypothetical protein